MSSFADAVASLLSTQRDALGVAVTYTPVVGDPLAITGIWDASRTARDGRYEGRLWVLRADVTPAKNDSFTIDGATYRVAEDPQDYPAPDDLGVWLHARK